MKISIDFTKIDYSFNYSKGRSALFLLNPTSFDCPGMLIRNDKKHEQRILIPMIL
jgi:hypothetical protein